ncbi:LCP family protein [Kitasatospora phosalacinea]|uniref:LCP family protein n=1 Tax=Kitasatospora phosalacinea TaxID=2065 RepID=UPI00068FD73D|nr:LCP family protein [Kitasatospora phosalacinea]
MDGGANGAVRGGDGEDGEFEVQLGAAFGLTGGGPEPEVTARLVDGGLAEGRRLRRARRRRTALLAGALTAAVVVGAGALALPRDLPGQRTSAVELAHSGQDPAPQPADGVTLLLVGTDSTLDAQSGPVPEDLRRGGLHSGDLHSGAAGRADVTDTLMLVHIPAGGGEVRQLSLPRDLLVPGPFGKEVELGGIYSDAERLAVQSLNGDGGSDEALRTRARESGRLALLKSVEQLTGVRVDHYAEVSMVGFYRAARALGGIPVCLNRAVDDPLSGASLPAGRQELGAAQALAFVRQRHGVGDGSDLVRTRRAQALLAGVVEKLRTGGVLSDASKLSELYRSLDGAVVVDQGWNPVDFVRQVPALAAGKGVFRTLPVVPDGGTGLRAPTGAARELLTGGDPAAPTPSEPSAALASPSPTAATTGIAPRAPEPVELGGVPCVD